MRRGLWCLICIFFSVPFVLAGEDAQKPKVDSRAPAAPTATHQSAVSTDVNGDGKVNPGDTVRSTTKVTNIGSTSGTNVQIRVPLDPNTTLVAGSLSRAPQGLMIATVATIVSIGLIVLRKAPI